MGIRMLVTLSPDTLILPEKTGTKTITGGNLSKYGGNQTYNCWKIVTDEDEIVETPLVGVSDGKHNTSKEQILDLGKIDVVAPVIERVSSEIDMTKQTATMVFNVSDKYLNTSDAITTNEITVLVNGTASNSVSKTLTRVPANDVTATIDGTTRTVSQQYKLTVSGFASNADQVKIRFNKGAATDTNGNGNNQKDIALYNMLRSAASEVADQSEFLGNTSIQRQNIENITFETNIPNTVYNELTGEYVDTTAWDVSSRQDKSIIAWYEISNSKGALKVHIGSNGEISANKDSQNLFKWIGYGDNCTETEMITNIELLNVSNVTSMQSMFAMAGGKAITKFSLGNNFDTKCN